MTKILPAGLCFEVRKGAWPVPNIFHQIQEKGRISEPEMFRTFNMGIGMALVFRSKDIPAVTSYFKRKKIKFYRIGSVVNDTKRKIVI